MFRKEAVDFSGERLSGEVIVAVPKSWQAIGYLMLLSLITLTSFLSVAKYDRIETVEGMMVPDKGIAGITASRTGVISSIFVVEGEIVKAGALLATIRVDEDLSSGSSISNAALAAANQQDASLIIQEQAVNAATTAQQAQINASLLGLRGEISEIRVQIELQRKSVGSATADLQQAEEVSKRGFISKRDMQVRRDNLLAREQQLSVLNQGLNSKQSALAEAEKSLVQISEQSRSQAAAISAARAQVAQQAATIKGSGEYILRAPIAGMVTALTTRIGQVATPEAPIMNIVASGSKLRAEVLIPGTAIGFTKRGQRVKLAIDAFAYQRFGNIAGTIETISQSAVTQRKSDGSTFAAYPAVVAVDQTSVIAYGKKHNLLPGMSLKAHIVTERRSLLQWLFDPIFAVKNR